VSDAENINESAERPRSPAQETEGQNSVEKGLSDSAVDAIAAIVVIACLVAIAATFISGGLA